MGATLLEEPDETFAVRIRQEIRRIMGHPGARLLRMSKYGLEPVALQDTEHFRIMREFVGDPHGMIEAMTED